MTPDATLTTTRKEQSCIQQDAKTQTPQGKQLDLTNTTQHAIATMRIYLISAFQ